ncbi:hypothetical protein VP01_1500g2 [Puccinia sorghi]|uniref:Uncharacterized protein n=1 Tax=Puccinia sorghi TaxID=27349 RepID=A0A0L6VKX5_9BASI|nr:hypothetical protein VP01_1500g2 [Puccinia sorghi]
MVYLFSIRFLVSWLLVPTIVGSITSRSHNGDAPASQPSASARARANRLLASKHKNHAKCPKSMTSCQIVPLIPKLKSLQSASPRKAKAAWECLDLQQELTACGKCDNDCMKLPNVENVGCENGRCKICEQSCIIYSCP